MKAKLTIFILLYFFCFTAQAKNRALLIGIGHYPKDSGWYEISSLNDIDTLEKTLQETFTITRLTDKDATHDGIIKALNALNNKTQYKDTLLIHFSGHGQQMLTNETDEVDLLDEAIVPYDAKAKNSNSYQGENHIKDNEFGFYVKKLREQAGKEGFVIVSIDACYSDSMDKGNQDNNEIYRGLMDIFGSQEISKDKLDSIRKNYHKIDNDSVEILPNGANVVFLSACKTDQKNQEIKINGKGFGSLTYAMCLAFSQYDFTNITKWLDLIESTMRDLVPRQNPTTRNTISYSFQHQKPITADTIIVLPPITDDGNTTKILTPILIALAVIAIIFFLLLWRKRKMK